jgi:hypothetical protein
MAESDDDLGGKSSEPKLRVSPEKDAAATPSRRSKE